MIANKPNKRNGHNQHTHPRRPSHTYLTKHLRSPERESIRNLTWIPLKKRLQDYLSVSPSGTASLIARYLHVRPSQIHRFSCPICEHDQEPCYSIGKALETYLNMQTKKYHLVNQWGIPLQSLQLHPEQVAGLRLYLMSGYGIEEAPDKPESQYAKIKKKTRKV